MAATQQINANQIALTPAQIMALPADQQQQYLKGLSPQMQAIYHQELINMGNADFMRNSVPQMSYCPVTGGSGNSATYAAGVTLNFDLPTTEGYATELWIRYALTVTPATGSGAGYQLTPAGKWALFTRVELDYGGAQIVTHPYQFFLDDLTVGQRSGGQNAVLAGNEDTAISAQIIDSTPLVVGSGNSWTGTIKIRLNPINRESPYGLLPLNGVGNSPQLKLTCSPNIYGTDPLLHAICANGGSGNAVTVSGTVKVDCKVLDGTNMEGIASKQLQGLIGMPTMQYGWESNLTPFNSGTLNVFTVKTKLEHWKMYAIVIDGQQSNAFVSALSNITSFGLAPDATLKQYMVNIGVANNIPIWDWFADRRSELGQDLPEGVIAWVDAATRGVVDPTNRNGSKILNCYGDGYPAASHAYQVTTTGSVCTPRVELFLCSKNRSGIKVGS